jgi:hypothetical protein
MAVINERFDLPHYVPTLRSQFDSIAITLADDIGEKVKFSAGKCLVKLHFRPVRRYY